MGMWGVGDSPGVVLTLGVYLILLGVLVEALQTTTTTGRPYIMNHPRNMTAVQGQRVVFSCGAEAFPDNITYYWYKDGKDVQHLPTYGKRLRLTGDQLLITGVVKEDMGWYTCRPSNGVGQDEASAYLNVTYFPRVLVDRMPVKVNWAKSFREKLDCPADANPPTVETLWTKGQTLLDSRGRFDILLNGTLLVTNVQESDGGSYFCTPVSLLGQGKPSPNVQVIVRDPPYFTLRPEPLYSKQVSQSVLMPCAASGTPSPSIAWRKVGQRINFSSPRIRQIGGNLSISATIKEDHGKYECVASNTIATIVSPTELVISNTTPHAPYNVSVVTKLFSAIISWVPAYDGNVTQFYMMWFRQKGGQWSQLTIPRDQSTTFTVYGLQPSTEYEFRVLSRNALGNGSFSEPVTARTLGYREDLVTALPTDASGVTYFPEVLKSLGPLPTPPRNVTGRVENDDTIVLMWLPSLASPVPVFWYEVSYRETGDSRWTLFSKPQHIQVNRVRIQDLKPGVYHMHVKAFGVLAASMPSNVVTVDLSADTSVLPDAMIGGIVGGILFLLVAVLLTTMAIIHSRRKDSKSRNGHTNYADVSYGKPEDMNSLQQAAPKRDRWQQNGGRDLVTSIGNNDSIFFLPRSHAHDLHANSGDLTSSRDHDPRFYDHDPLYNKNDSGYNMTRPPPPAYGDEKRSSGRYNPHSPLSYQSSQPLIFNDTQPLMTQPRPRSRSQPSERSHRFPSDPYDPRSPRPRDVEFSYPQYPSMRGYPGPYSREGNSHDQSPQQHLPSSQAPPPYRSSGGSGGEDYPPKPARAHAAYRRQANAQSDWNSPPRDLDEPQRGYDGPFQSFQSEEDDDVFPSGSLPHSSGRQATFPRHSSMKPGAPQTLMPGEEDEAPAFTLSDISSVLDPPPEQPALPPPRRSWQPSQESSRSIPPHGEDSRDGRSSGKPLARVWPSPKTADDSSDSSGRPLGYTRDQLHDVVDRLRQAPRSHAVPGDRYLDVSSQVPRNGARDVYPNHHDNPHAPKPGRPSHSYLSDRRPEDNSTSSGIGSRNTSQSTNSFRPRSKPAANSMSSLLTPHESSIAEDSSLPFMDSRNSNNRRDTSADENYEFDHLPALESDILDDLHRYSRLAGAGQSGAPGDLRDLYPKPRRQSQYADAEQRFEKLREEFQHYRQQQETGSPRYMGPERPMPLYSMDSEML